MKKIFALGALALLCNNLCAVAPDFDVSIKREELITISNNTDQIMRAELKIGRPYEPKIQRYIIAPRHTISLMASRSDMLLELQITDAQGTGKTLYSDELQWAQHMAKGDMLSINIGWSAFWVSWFVSKSSWNITFKWLAPLANAAQVEPQNIAAMLAGFEDESPMLQVFKARYQDIVQGIPNELIDTEVMSSIEGQLKEHPEERDLSSLIMMRALAKKLGMQLIESPYVVGRGNFGIYIDGVSYDNEAQAETPQVRLWSNLLLRNAPAHVRQKVFEQMVDSYKIHLMPKPGQRVAVLIRLIEFLKKHPEVARYIAMIKARKGNKTHSQKQIKMYGMLPEIVIYVQRKPHIVQQVLDALYQEFKGIQGSAIGPEFNGRVTDLIWVAQGNRDEKIDGRFDAYYEKPHKIYYKADIGGAFANYHLQHPKTGKDIVD